MEFRSRNDPANCLCYLFRRPASKRSPEPTGTTAMPRWNPKRAGDFEQKVGIKLSKKLPKSAEAALKNVHEIEDWEREALESFAKIASCAPQILNDIAVKHADAKRGGILTLGWRLPDGQLRRVGEFKAFQAMPHSSRPHQCDQHENPREVCGRRPMLYLRRKSRRGRGLHAN